MPKVLITGIAGAQGRLVARRLRAGFAVCGVDRAGWPRRPRDVRVHAVDLRKKRFEDVIRREQPDAIVHLGFLHDLRAKDRLRHDVNVRGTKQLLDHCLRHGVESLVVVSSALLYGAAPENPCALDEDAPLSGSRTYPQMRDLVEVDGLAAGFLWKYPQIRTCVLRPVNVLGSEVHSPLGAYLRLARVPSVMGFDPMLQFLHEQDLSEAIALVLQRELRGVFNVVGPGAVPLSVAVRECGGRRVPLPEPLARPVIDRLFRLGLFSYPPGAIDFLKYPVTVSGERFAEATGFKALFGLEEIFESVRG